MIAALKAGPDAYGRFTESWADFPVPQKMFDAGIKSTLQCNTKYPNDAMRRMQCAGFIS